MNTKAFNMSVFISSPYKMMHPTHIFLSDSKIYPVSVKWAFDRKICMLLLSNKIQNSSYKIVILLVLTNEIYLFCLDRLLISHSKNTIWIKKFMIYFKLAELKSKQLIMQNVWVFKFNPTRRVPYNLVLNNK